MVEAALGRAEVSKSIPSQWVLTSDTMRALSSCGKRDGLPDFDAGVRWSCTLEGAGSTVSLGLAPIPLADRSVSRLRADVSAHFGRLGIAEGPLKQRPNLQWKSKQSRLTNEQSCGYAAVLCPPLVISEREE